MKIRPNTWDAAICQSVMADNEYNLPEDMTGMVVLDIGAHIGSFLKACHDRGARRVICYEPDKDNFELLVVNAQECADSVEVELWNKAVTGEVAENLKIRRLRNHDFGNGPNTGHVDVFGYDEKDGFTSVAINDVLKSVGCPIDLIKIDCEGAEWGILEHGDFSDTTKLIVELHAVQSGDHPITDGLKEESLSTLAQQAVRTLAKKGMTGKITSLSEALGKMIVTKRSTTAVKASTKKLLWMSHAGIISGYGKVTENICKRLFEMGWDVRIYGIGYDGYPHNMPYKIYPAYDTGSNLKPIIDNMEPDAVVICDDHFNIAIRVNMLTSMGLYPPVIGYAAVDSENVRRDIAATFRTLKHAIFHTEFGVQELRKVGYKGPASVAGHGVDLNRFQPYDKTNAREHISVFMPNVQLKSAFIWGLVGVNQPRKRIDLSLAYFAEWWKRAGKPDDAYIYMHSDAKGVWDVPQLADYLGIKGRILTTSRALLPESHMPSMYSIFDAMISTAEGESWGMCQQEAMACGIPQIAVQCGGMPYWAKDAIYWVKPSQYVFTPNQTNTKRWIASEEDFVKAMSDMYSSAALRGEYSKRGLELVRSMPSWDDIALHFHDTLTQVIRRVEDASSGDVSDEFAGAECAKPATRTVKETDANYLATLYEQNL